MWSNCDTLIGYLATTFFFQKPSGPLRLNAMPILVHFPDEPVEPYPGLSIRFTLTCRRHRMTLSMTIFRDGKQVAAQAVLAEQP